LLQQPEHFATELPFPVLAASEPAFDPDGYWNGAVWVDHAVLALAALGDEGRALRERFLERLAGEDSLFECYSPVDGRPARGARPATAQFSWTAAALVGLLSGGPRSVAR
jgi:putative isomerase